MHGWKCHQIAWSDLELYHTFIKRHKRVCKGGLFPLIRNQSTLLPDTHFSFFPPSFSALATQNMRGQCIFSCILDSYTSSMQNQNIAANAVDTMESLKKFRYRICRDNNNNNSYIVSCLIKIYTLKVLYIININMTIKKAQAPQMHTTIHQY